MLTMSKLILLIDDDPDILALCGRSLQKSGFDVITADDAVHGLDLIHRARPDMVIMDIMMPGMDGLELCRIIRRESNVPIIFLTARVSEADVLVGLELGADDYIAKPFSMQELIARIRSVLRRAGSKPDNDVIRVGKVVLDRDHYEVELQGRRIALTPTEFEFLATLMSQPGRIFSRGQLLAAVHGEGYDGYEPTIKSHINNLRKKMGPGHYITSVYGVGYKFEE
jgi:DNA-binding response OmpR family regulator